MPHNRIALDTSRSTNFGSVFISRCKSVVERLNDFIACTWPDEHNRPGQAMFMDLEPGSVSINNMCLRAWLFTVTPHNATLPPSEMVIYKSFGCEQDRLTGKISVPTELATHLRFLRFANISLHKTTGDWDPDVRDINYKMMEDIKDFAMAGIEIINLANLVLHPKNLYMLPRAGSATIGEIPIIKVEALDRNTVLEMIRFTQLLSQAFGGVMLRPSKLYPEAWVDGYQHVKEYARSKDAETHWGEDASNAGLPNNLADQVLTNLATLPGVYELSSQPVKNQRASFDFTSLWKDKDAESTVEVPMWLENCTFLSKDAKEALAALPDHLNKRKPVRYLAGIGSNIRGESVLEGIDHPRKDTLKFLPQLLVFAGTLYYYVHSCAHIGDTDRRIDAAFRTTLDHAPGTISPWTYVGTKGSVFPLHQEDALLPSANQLVLGHPKVWINITPYHLMRLQGLMESHIHPCYPLHRGTFLHPLFLHNRGIAFNVVVQKQGDLFLPHAAAAHQGWNAGNNMAEAVNYADVPAYKYIKDNLIYGEEGVWPCVCDKYPLPGKPRPATGDFTAKLYNPTDTGSDRLSCTAFYKWFMILERNLDPHIPDGKDLIPAEILIRMRRYVYTRMQGEYVPTEPDH